MTAQTFGPLTQLDALAEGAPFDDKLQMAFERVSRSRAFRRAKKLLELLRFSVEAAADGTILDQARVARALFGKDENFDYNTDPLVRVQFSRLRMRIEEYYAGEGAADPFRIHISPRGYEIRAEPNHQNQNNHQPNGHALAAGETGGDGADIKEGDRCPQLNSTSGEAQARSQEAEAKGPKTCSLAVLPFVNLTNDEDRDVFCHGLTDELISALTPWDEVDVLSRGSSFQFGSAPMDIRELGRELGVSMVLEGSVRMEQERTRVTSQLCSTETGFTLWSESFEHENGNLLDVETSMAQEMVSKLKSVMPTLIEPCAGESAENQDQETELLLT